MKIMLGLLLYAIVAYAAADSLQLPNVSIPTHRASRGYDALLPCGNDKQLLESPGLSLRWTKNNEIIYKYPIDERYKRRLVTDHMFKRKCDDAECPDNTWLLIENVQDSDAGLYECRVFFQGIAGADFITNLVVVGPPGKPRIYDEKSHEVVNVIGPLHIGSTLTLICEVSKEYENSTISWTRNGVSLKITPNDAIKNRAVMTKYHITRDEMNAVYTCYAQTADFTKPLSATVVVKMILSPLSVEIRRDDKAWFEAEEPCVVDCVIYGCAPPPTVKWFLGGTLFKSRIHTDNHMGNHTVSSIILVPRIYDNNRTLTCQAENHLLPDKIFENSIILNVGYPPTCVLNFNLPKPKLGVVKGESEIATCYINSLPEPLYVNWTTDHEGPYPATFSPLIASPNIYVSTFSWDQYQSEYANDTQALYCSATNILGSQVEACPVAIVKGGPPARPQCGLMAQNIKSIKINCSDSINYTTICYKEGYILLVRGETHTSSGISKGCNVCYKEELCIYALQVPCKCRASMDAVHTPQQLLDLLQRTWAAILQTWDGGRPAVLHVEVKNKEGDIVEEYVQDSRLFKLKRLSEMNDVLDGNYSIMVYSSNVRGRSKSLMLSPSLPAFESNTQRKPIPWAILVGIVTLLVFLLIIFQVTQLIRKKIRRPEGERRLSCIFYRSLDYPVLTWQERFQANVSANRNSPCPVVRYAHSPDGTDHVIIGRNTERTAPATEERQTYYV